MAIGVLLAMFGGGIDGRALMTVESAV